MWIMATAWPWEVPPGVHGFDKTEVVRVLAQVWPKVADPLSALPVLLEFPNRVEDAAIAGLVLEGDIQVVETLEGKFFAVVFLEFGFGIKGIDLGNTAVHEEEDDPLGLRGMVGARDGIGS